ncbi:unnamed protein product, partial [Prorocentrum cordatum]
RRDTGEIPLKCAVAARKQATSKLQNASVYSTEEAIRARRNPKQLRSRGPPL